MHFLINEYFSRPSWRAPGRASPLAQRPSRPTGASRGLGRSLAAPGEAEGLVWLWDTPNFEAKLVIPVPGAAPVKDARTGPGSSNRAVPANPLPPVPEGEDLGERVALFWLLDGVLIKNSLRGARRGAMNISGILQNNQVGVWVGGMHRGEAAPGAGLGPSLRPGGSGHLRSVGATVATAGPQPRGSVLLRYQP